MVVRDKPKKLSTPTSRRLGANGRVKIARAESDDRFPVMSFGNSRKPGPWKGKAAFDVLQSGRSGRMFFAIYADRELVLLHSMADGFDEERPEIESFNISTEYCRAIKASMREIIDKALNSEGSAAIYRNHYKTSSEKNTDAMYRNWCGALMTIIGPEAELSEEPGMPLEVCGRDTKFLRTLAALGCIGSPVFDQDDLDRVCSANGLTAEQFKARAATIEKEHNLRLMYPLGSSLAVTV